jgi:hypothetical protein
MVHKHWIAQGADQGSSLPSANIGSWLGAAPRLS